MHVKNVNVWLYDVHDSLPNLWNARPLGQGGSDPKAEPMCPYGEHVFDLRDWIFFFYSNINSRKTKFMIMFFIKLSTQIVWWFCTRADIVKNISKKFTNRDKGDWMAEIKPQIDLQYFFDDLSRHNYLKLF